MRIALIGATGLVGSLLAERLAATGEHELHALVRTPAGRVHPGWTEHAFPPDRWPDAVRAIAPEVAISAIGTTMRKAGSNAAFRAVDHDLLLAFAAAARAASADRMIAVSSVGADPRSRNFYLRLKGEVETALSGLGFDRVDLIRPGLLRGERGADRRFGERIGILVSPLVNMLLRGPLDRYAAIDAGVVADAIAALLRQPAPGTFVHENRALKALARRVL